MVRGSGPPRDPASGIPLQVVPSIGGGRGRVGTASITPPPLKVTSFLATPERGGGERSSASPPLPQIWNIQVREGESPPHKQCQHLPEGRTAQTGKKLHPCATGWASLPPHQVWVPGWGCAAGERGGSSSLSPYPLPDLLPKGLPPLQIPLLKVPIWSRPSVPPP